MKRIEAIKTILSNVSDEVVISSTGMISREVFQVKDRDRNFYMQGSMGCALAIGIGIAYNRPDLKVIVISGDGAVLMSLGTLVLHKKLGLNNLSHFILDNNCHASTGGQITCSDCINFENLAPNTFSIKVDKDNSDAPRINILPHKIKERFENAIRINCT
jgi:thiamine pyrophosphate-dependent acetolactate synthase large subunit-like protein